MYVMSWFGIGTAISFVIDVPILLRSLADSLADLNLDHAPRFQLIHVGSMG